MKPVVPESEGPLGDPFQFRIYVALDERIERIAKKTGNTKADTMRHMLKWAADEYDAQERAAKAAR